MVLCTFSDVMIISETIIIQSSSWYKSDITYSKAGKGDRLKEEADRSAEISKMWVTELRKRLVSRYLVDYGDCVSCYILPPVMTLRGYKI